MHKNTLLIYSFDIFFLHIFYCYYNSFAFNGPPHQTYEYISEIRGQSAWEFVCHLQLLLNAHPIDMLEWWSNLSVSILRVYSFRRCQNSVLFTISFSFDW